MSGRADHATVLVVDDEPRMRRYMAALLAGAGYTVVEAVSGREALTMAASHRPDLILLDLGLPDVDGLEVTRSLREWSDVPVLVVSAREQELDKVQALDLGADDYLTKPFGAGELLARIRAMLRRQAQAATHDAEPVFRSGRLRVDLALREVRVEGKVVELTPLEYRLLTLMVKHAGKVLTHRQILRDVWGPNLVEHAHYVRIFMAGLRRKMERDPARPELFITESGVGYRLRVMDPSPEN